MSSSILCSASPLKNFLFVGDAKAELSDKGNDFLIMLCANSGCVLSASSALSFVSYVLVFWFSVL